VTTPASIVILATGPLAIVEDLGRPGLAHLGVGHSGACDEPAHRLANRIVGNRESAATLEVTVGGLAVRFTHPTWLALTGASAPVRLAGRQASFFSPLFARAGSELHLGWSSTGVRSYLAVRGGIDTRPVLGSRATDLLANLGIEALRPGSVLPVGGDIDGPIAGLDVIPTRPIDADPVLEVLPAPRPDLFADGAVEELAASIWRVSPDSNRVGLRLDGPILQRALDTELPSEGVVTGAVQVPPSGQPIVLLADHPVTGGYPVIAVVRRSSLPTAAQVRTGQHLRFRITRPNGMSPR
jgi:biotin-dependent carboxylase-like uncharacterized protein